MKYNNNDKYTPNRYNLCLLHVQLTAEREDRLITREDEPQTICFRPGTDKNAANMTVFQHKISGQVSLVNTTCKESGNNRKPFLLLCGGKQQNSFKDLPCQCPGANQLSKLIANKTSSSGKKKKNGFNNSQSLTTNQLMCADYSEINLAAAVRFLSPHNDATGTTNALLILSRFYQYDNIIDLVHQVILADSKNAKATTSNKENALMLLCKHFTGDKIMEVADLLIENGVDIEQKDNEGNTALTLLCSNSKNKKIVKVAELLIEKGIAANQANNLGDNALMSLCQHSQSDSILQFAEMLIKKGLDVNHRNSFGENALIVLCKSSENDQIFQVAELLIAEGIDVNLENNLGESALMRLCEHSESDKIVEVAELLIENGVDIEGTNYDRENALMKLLKHSKSEKIYEVAELLITKGIDINQKDKYGENAVDYLNARSLEDVPNKSQILKLIKKKKAK